MEKKCNCCKKIISTEQFQRRGRTKDNLSYCCKACLSEKSRVKDKSSNLKLSRFAKDDIDGVYKLLETLGYDITQDIHSQFIKRAEEKYGVLMTYKNRRYERISKHFDEYKQKKGLL